MARGINKVIIVGNVGKDPETRVLPSGGYVTNLAIATSETWKDKKGIRINWLIRALAFKSRSQVSNGKYGLS